MPVTAVAGINWGDEGKGRVVDALAETADMVVRYQGGNNAGHTVMNEMGKFALHLIPSGIFRPGVLNLIGPGAVVNPQALVEELDELTAAGVDVSGLRVSNRAHVVLPWHIEQDQAEEARLKDKKFGSTKRGIAPVYADKCLKIGIQMGDLLDESVLRPKLDRLYDVKQGIFDGLYHKQLTPPAQVAEELAPAVERIRDYICDTLPLTLDAVARDQHILLEGQLGALRDLNWGIYPYTTSSCPVPGFASVGAGIPPKAINRVVGVMKAYSTCVGEGPFVTELEGDVAHAIREEGGEYGASTGRPRRIGWFDAVASRYGCQVTGATEVVLPLVDVLGILDDIQVCVAYEIDGERTDAFPFPSLLPRCKPVYESIPGWRQPLDDVKSYADMPDALKRYVDRLEELVATPITLVSFGPEREKMVERR